MPSKALAILALVGACVRLPHVDPAPRNDVTQYLTSVPLSVQCGDGQFWADNKAGTGVIISERHVLTAYHVTACPTIPTVRVTFTTSDGPKTLRMYVIKESESQDIAKLEIASAEYFNLNVPPPELVTGNVANEGACAWPERGGICGIVDADNTIVMGMNARKGDSGAGVYLRGIDYSTALYTDKAGLLLGLISKKGVGYTRIVRVTSEWLEGT